MGWYEAPVDPFVATLLVDLCDTVWALRRERNEVKAALADAVVKMEQQKKEIAGLKLANDAMSAGKRCQAPESRMMRLWVLGLLGSLVSGAIFMRLG